MSTTFKALSALVSRALIATQAGLTFGGARDLYRVLGYKRALLPSDYKDRYKRDGIAARINDALPDATWRGVGELIEDETTEEMTTFETEWEELQRRLNIWPMLNRMDRLAGLGRYAVMLIGTAGTGKPDTELKKVKAKDITYVSVYEEECAKVVTWEEDYANERFGMPKTYSINAGEPGQRQRWMTVHYSRVLHFADNILIGEVFGEPRLQGVWNRLDDLDKIVGGGAEAFWLRANQGRIFNLDKDMDVETTELDQMSEQLEELQHGIRRDMRTRGMNVQQLGSDVAGIAESAASVLGIIAGSTGIPQRILLGSERGQLASEQDRNNWADRVGERRTAVAEPRAVRPLIDRLIKWGALTEPKQYSVRWPPTLTMSEREKAENGQKYANVNRTFGRVVITEDEIRGRVWGWPPLAEKDKGPLQLQTGPKELPTGKQPDEQNQRPGSVPVDKTTVPAEEGAKA